MKAVAVALALFVVAIGVGSGCSDGGDDTNTTNEINGAAGMLPPAPPASAGGAGGGNANAAGSGGAVTPSSSGAGGSGGSTPSAGSGGAPAGNAGASGAAGGNGPRAGQSADSGMPDAGAEPPAVDAGTGEHTAATPSAGCGKGAGRPQNGVVSTQSYYLKFPESYDGTRPFPVLVGFHGCGSGNRGTSANDTEWMRLTETSAFASDYVRAVPVSADAGGCWSYGTDIARVKQMYDELLASYCVDSSRVFATGHSSGSQFIVQILTTNHTADAQHLSFKAVAPVAASDYGAIAGPMPVMYIQGMMDKERGNGDGHETVERFRAANSCGNTSMPYSQVMGCKSGTTSVNPGCVVYDGCKAPTIWCSHNDPAYSGTMHGVPCFGVTAMHDFFESSL